MPASRSGAASLTLQCSQFRQSGHVKQRRASNPKLPLRCNKDRQSRCRTSAISRRLRQRLLKRGYVFARTAARPDTRCCLPARLNHVVSQEVDIQTVSPMFRNPNRRTSARSSICNSIVFASSGRTQHIAAGTEILVPQCGRDVEVVNEHVADNLAICCKCGQAWPSTNCPTDLPASSMATSRVWMSQVAWFLSCFMGSESHDIPL